MLRVVPSGNAAAAQRYHANALKREDYYSQGQEIAGQWHGRAAKLLGLSGDVTTPQFAALTEARNPTTGKQLTPRINAERLAGYDMNFHAPKSLSVLQALTGDKDLVTVFREAVDETMADIEQMAATRVRIRGAQEDRVTSNFVWADYVHFTARPVDGLPDPHLHVHCFVMNLTFDQVEGRWKAAKFHDIKVEAPHFEAAFHARLAKKISDLGYEIRRTRNRWEVVGIPDSVIRKNSRRMIEIEKLAEELGITDAKKKDELGAKTRKGKRKGISSNELLKEWKSRLTAEELEAVKQCYSKKPSSRQHHKVTPEEALEFAEEKCFERDSVVKRNKLVAAALRYGVGHVVPADMARALAKRGMIERSFNGEVLCTTPEIMMEEARLIQRVRDGRGKLAPLIPGRIRYSRDFLSKEQREAVRHVLHSNDRVIAIRGVAGAGKTTVLQEIREQLNAAGIKTFAFAQSGTASRDVLRSAGFAGADTIARLLNDRDLQLRVRGSLLIIDESGIVGIRDMARIMEIVGEGRVLSVGDTKQHAPVSRGEPVRLLEEYSGMPVAEIRQIRRQEKVAYRDAIKALSEGDTTAGFAMLEHLGAVVEISGDKVRYQTLAEEYFQCMDLTGKTPLVVSPTHFEGRAVTQAIREQLASRGKIGQDHAFLQYRELKWEAAEKRRVENYSEGMVLQFHQNANGIKRGSTLVIAAVDREEKTVFLQGPKGEKIPLNWKQTDRFQVYEKSEISLAVGDVIKVTRGSSDLKGKRLNNGTMLTIKKIGADGRITMENGVVLPGNHGHLTHGYCDTSHASQGRTVDDVFVAQSAASFLAASKEGFYVSCSRGKQNIRIFTDDKLELLRAIGKSSKRLSALEFGGVGREVFMTPGLDGVEWVKWIAKEKARHHEPGPHEVKLLTSRRGKDPRKPSSNPQKKPEGISWEAYIKMRRENNEPDGKSRSRGSGRTKPKKREKTVNDPRNALRESRREKAVKAESKDTSKQKKQKPETKASKKVEAVAKGLSKSLKNSLPEKAISKKQGRKISIGDVKVDAKTFSGKTATKVQENREQRKERAAATQKKTVKKAPEKTPEKKAQRPEKKIEKPKIQPPPPSPGRKR